MFFVIFTRTLIKIKMYLRGKKGFIVKGLTKEQFLDFKSKNEVLKTCLTCKGDITNKDVDGGLNSNGYRYLSIPNICNKCKYKKKLLKYGNKVSLYNATQTYNQTFKIEHRAAYINNCARNRAKNTGKEFSIKKQDVLELLLPLKCKITNIDLQINADKHNPFAPSLDRIDNTKGYTKENIQIVCQIYNFCKNQFSDIQVKEFLSLCKLI